MQSESVSLRHQSILRLMEHGSRVLGLRLCFHDRTGRSGLSRDWTLHTNSHCVATKAVCPDACRQFDGIDTAAALTGCPEGRIQRCDAGFTELAAPVTCSGILGGVLFAGQCWLGEGPPPFPDLIVPPSYEWLEERLPVVRAYATELGRLLELASPGGMRRQEITAFLEAHARERLTLSMLAHTLHLSESRTGHLVRELFGMTFPELVRAVRLGYAARMLVLTDEPVGQVAFASGFSDQNYFTRLFTRAHGLSPRAYRRAHARV